jgi:hypothetical protein
MLLSCAQPVPAAWPRLALETHDGGIWLGLCWPALGLNGPSLPLDVGQTDDIPVHLRRLMALRDQTC